MHLHLECVDRRLGHRPSGVQELRREPADTDSVDHSSLYQFVEGPERLFGVVDLV
jgi:hypothetical protein